jgi:hypothetical protein
MFDVKSKPNSEDGKKVKLALEFIREYEDLHYPNILNYEENFIVYFYICLCHCYAVLHKSQKYNSVDRFNFPAYINDKFGRKFLEKLKTSYKKKDTDF